MHSAMYDLNQKIMPCKLGMPLTGFGAQFDGTACKTSAFMKKYANIRATRTSDGFNPLLEFGTNTSVYIGKAGQPCCGATGQPCSSCLTDNCSLLLQHCCLAAWLP